MGLNWHIFLPLLPKCHCIDFCGHGYKQNYWCLMEEETTTTTDFSSFGIIASRIFAKELSQPVTITDRARIQQLPSTITLMFVGVVNSLVLLFSVTCDSKVKSNSGSDD